MSAANRRLAQQLANRPGVNQVGGGNAAAVMYQQQQQMMMGGGQGRGAGGARGGRGALRGAGAIKVSQQFFCNYVGISLSFIGFWSIHLIICTVIILCPLLFHNVFVNLVLLIHVS